MSRKVPAKRSDFGTFRRFTTRWADNDAYGHVNNTVYYEWFDSAVNGWLVEQGLLDIQAGDPIAFVVETSCTYFTPLEFPQDIEVGFAVDELRRSSIRYRIGIFADGSATAAAQGEFVHVLVDRGSRRPIEMPQNWRTVLESLS